MVGSGSSRRRSRQELDAIADGVSDGSLLGEFVSEMRSLGDGVEVEPSRALTEFVTAPRREPDLVVAAAATESKASTPVIAHLSAFAATTIGKVALTGGVAAAAVGGAVVVNEIQEPASVEVIAVADDDSSSSSGSSSTTGPDSSTGTVANSSSSTSSSSSSTTVGGQAAAADTDPITIDADGAGTVTYQVLDGQLVLIDVTPADGWTVRDETTPHEIDLSFRTSGGVERVDLDIEIEDGQPRVRIERRLDDDDDDSGESEDD